MSHSVLLPGPAIETTTLASRGQIVIPKVLRDARRWQAGTSFVEEDVPQGLLLRPVTSFARTDVEEVMGCTVYRGRALSQADIEAALGGDVARRYKIVKQRGDGWMIGLDTNVLLLCLTLDDPSQVPAARALLAHGHGVFVAKTVVLELEWVLRAAYRSPRTTIHSALGELLGPPNLVAQPWADQSGTRRVFTRPGLRRSVPLGR